MTQLTPEMALDMEVLEAMVNRHGLKAVLTVLHAVCLDKAEHLLNNWQDSASARYWLEDAQRIATIARNVEN